MAQVNGKNNGRILEVKDTAPLPSSSEPMTGLHSAVPSLTPDGNESRRLPEGLDDTAHLLSFASEGNVKLTKRVLESGVDVNASDYDGRTALHLAASEGRIEVIKLLLSMGANVNPTDRWGSTPLADALHYGFIEASKLLKSTGGKVPAESGHLSTPMLSPARSPGPGDSFEIDVSELDFHNATLVGQGAFGEIRLVNWRGTRVAVKTLHTQLSARPEVEREFRDELMLLKKLRHPNIVQFLGAVTLSQPMMLITEYLSRGDLHEILQRKGPLCAEEAVHYALDIARGMSYLHQHKPESIVHRDLKPINLLRDEAGHLKVADFGLSRLLKTQSSEELQEAFELSGDKSSFLYVAPELLCKKSYDKSVDVYSFAIIVFEMFEGSRAVNEENPKDFEDPSAQNTRPNFKATTYPPGMKELITRCWDQDPRRRPPFLEIVGILEEMEVGLSEIRLEHRHSDEGHGSSGGRCACIIL